MRIVQSSFLLMALMWALSIGVLYWIGARVAAATQQAMATHANIDLLNKTLSDLKDAETGQRGYIITGHEKYLIPYESAQTEISHDIPALNQQAAIGAIDAQELSSLEQLISDKLEELAKIISLRKTQSFDAAATEVDTGRGRHLMNEIRRSISIMIQRLAVRLSDDDRLVYLAGVWRNVVFVAAALANLLLFAMAYRRIQATLSQRDAALLELRQQKDLVAVTLASIGDGVIVTDLKGRLTYMNPEGEKLTGWMLSDVMGEACEKVFHIVNETSRQRVESPVDKVLKSGLVVGLANHTLLIRRDGTELPVDDSGAPICNPDGSVRGVVLVFRDFTDHKEAEKKLHDAMVLLNTAKEAAESANIAKDNFLATLSHELRTPLSPVLATLNLWESTLELPPELLGDRQMLRRNVELEARLIDDLLDLTRIVRGKLPLNLETVDVNPLVESVAEMYQSESSGKKLNVSIDLTAARHHVHADPARLQQVFWNIFKNAIKFTPAGGSISITSTNDAENRIELAFCDSGIGMEAETMARLFEPFEQGSAETVRHYGGLGLGMSISRSLVEAQGGTIMAESKGPGKGSTFKVSLPTIAEPRQDVVGSAVEAEEHRSLNILLVEDHLDTARAMSRLLRSQGHTVRAAGTVAEAMESAVQPFDLLLSDIGLPDGTGMELIVQLRKQYGDKITAIALTGFGMEADLERCRKAGFDNHLTKPVNLQSLERMLQQVSKKA